MRVGLWRRLSAEELMLLNCGVGEDSWESLGLQGDPTSPFWRRSALDFFGRNDAKAEAPVLWPPHAKSWLIGKDSDAGRNWGQEEKGTTEYEMAGWHHWLDGRESEWTLGVGDGQGGLACCDSWCHKELDMTEWVIWSDLIWSLPWRALVSPRSYLELSSYLFQSLNNCTRNVACFCSPPLPCSVVISEEESYKLYLQGFLANWLSAEFIQ